MNRTDFPSLCHAPGLVRLHGHRGMRGLMPENTLPGFAAAFAAGVQIVELDILVTRDDVPVVLHDPQLSGAQTRDATGRWLEADSPPIITLSYAQLAGYDVGSRDPRATDGESWPQQARLDGVPVPKLADICALAKQPAHQECWLNIEIKSSPLASYLTPPPDRLAELVTAEIRAAGLGGRTLLQSFDWRILEAAQAIAPEIPRSCVTYYPDDGAADEITVYPNSPYMGGAVLEEAASKDISSQLPRLVRQAGAVHWAPYFKDITASHVEAAQAEGLIVSVWTVNERQDIEQMIDFGVDGIITDYPQRAQQLLQQRGMRWTDAEPAAG